MFVSARGSSTADHGLRELPKFVGHVQNQGCIEDIDDQGRTDSEKHNLEWKH